MWIRLGNYNSKLVNYRKRTLGLKRKIKERRGGRKCTKRYKLVVVSSIFISFYILLFQVWCKKRFTPSILQIQNRGASSFWER
jgi:hypothetical protein